MVKNESIVVPADVPVAMQADFTSNYRAITGSSGRLMLFAADQKIEHLNATFFGPGIHADAQHPQNLFQIASQGAIGLFATHLGLIARYGKQYPKVNYLIKINGKSNIIPRDAKDPLSSQLWSVADVVAFKQQSGLAIRAVGYTLYLGSKYEPLMLHQAAQMVYQAHQHGLVAILWIYPRGKYVTDDRSGDIIAGAAGVANSLGADFVKVNAPIFQGGQSSAELLQQAVAAAGNTKVICSGGPMIDTEEFLHDLHAQIHVGGTAGNATGRNIYQRSLADALAYTKAIAAIVHDNKDVQEALEIYASGN